MAGFKSTLELTVEGRDDPIVVAYSAVDLRRYEAAFERSTLSNPMDITMLTYLGWSAARRQGLLNGSYGKYADFDEVCTWVRAVPAETDEETDDAAHPTSTGAGDSS